MKEPFSMERGRVVESTQGRDKGKPFLILERRGKDLVLIADGRSHKLSNPKKKKTKHLRAKPVLIDWESLRPEGGAIQDSDVRRALEKNGFTAERSLCKEG